MPSLKQMSFLGQCEIALDIREVINRRLKMSYHKKRVATQAVAVAMPIIRVALIAQALLAIDAFLALYEKGFLFRYLFSIL